MINQIMTLWYFSLAKFECCLWRTSVYQKHKCIYQTWFTMTLHGITFACSNHKYCLVPGAGRMQGALLLQRRCRRWMRQLHPPVRPCRADSAEQQRGQWLFVLHCWTHLDRAAMLPLRGPRPAHFALFFCFYFLKPTSVLAFNLDTNQVIRKNGEPGSLFGFSLAMHRQLGPDQRM